MTRVRVAVVGAAGTGKTTLCRDLAAHLRGLGLRAMAVPEALDGWCERAGRTPRAEERLDIAREQESRVDAAAGDADIVIADTTALVVATHAGMSSGAGELHRFAIARQRQYDATLLTGLDVGCESGGPQRDAAHAREEVDTLLRTLLQQAAVPFQVVYGSGPQRLRSAIQALAATGVLPSGMGDIADDQERGKPWAWMCEKCSDPACEHRLFAQLRDARQERNP